MKGVCGFLNSECMVRFGISFPEISHFDATKKFPLLKDSKSHEKGSCLPFDDNTYDHALLEYVGVGSLTTINMDLHEIKTKPLIKISCNVPNAELMVISEFYIQGYIEIDKVNFNKRSVDGKALMKKLIEKKKVSIDDKIFFEVIGPPLIKEETIQTEYGAVNRIRKSLDIDI